MECFKFEREHTEECSLYPCRGLQMYQQGRADERAKVINEVHEKYTVLSESEFAKWLGEKWFEVN